MNAKKLRWVCMFLLCISIASAIYTIVEQGPPKDPNRSELMITAAHIPKEEFPTYTLIHVNEELDKAYYLDNSYIPVQQEVGTRVQLGETLKGTVKENTDFLFLVEADNVDAIVKGLSGSTVSVNGRDIGVVSALVEGGLLKCIYY